MAQKRLLTVFILSNEARRQGQLTKEYLLTPTSYFSNLQLPFNRVPTVREKSAGNGDFEEGQESQ